MRCSLVVSSHLSGGGLAQNGTVSLGEGGTDVDGKELLALSTVLLHAAGLLAEHGLGLQVGVPAGSLVPMLQSSNDHVGRDAAGGNAHETVGGPTTESVDIGLQEILHGNIDAVIEQVGWAEDTVHGGAGRGVSADGEEDADAKAVGALAASLAIQLNGVVLLRLEALPADHPLIVVLLEEFDLSGHFFFLPLFRILKQVRRVKHKKSIIIMGVSEF